MNTQTNFINTLRVTIAGSSFFVAFSSNDITAEQPFAGKILMTFS